MADDELEGACKLAASIPVPTILLEPDGTVLAISRSATRDSLPPGIQVGANLPALIGAGRYRLRQRLSRAVQHSVPTSVMLPAGDEVLPFRLWCVSIGQRPLIMLQWDPETDSLGDRLALRGKARRLETSLKISERQRQQLEAEAKRLAFAATHDVKTGLLNSMAFERQVCALLASGDASGSLIYMDIDGFKPVNDTYGHTVGDRVLRTLAARLQACMRDEDLLARLGGDEFAAWLDTAASIHDAQVLGRIDATVQRPITLFEEASESVRISVSTGVARAPEDGTRYDELLTLADARMYFQKRAAHEAPPRSLKV